MGSPSPGQVFRRSGIDIREVVIAHGSNRTGKASQSRPADYTEVTQDVERHQPEAERFLVSLWKSLLPRDP